MRVHRTIIPTSILLALGALTGLSVQAAASDDADGRIEAFLREGRVVEADEIGSGVTRPMRLRLELDGRQMKAAFKTVNVYESGVKRHATRGFEQNFDDSYRYDRAAYLLDRHLGLRMVPVTVLRRYDDRDGAAIAWISDAVTESDRRDRGLEPPDPYALELQRRLMYLFDALIHNDDRNLGNQLITTADWRLHLIDHSRSFRLGKNLPAVFKANPARLPRQIYDRLRGLNADALGELLGDLVTKARIRAMLVRRDAIVAKIDADLAELGESYVFAD